MKITNKLFFRLNIGKSWDFTRTACLGNEIYNRLNLSSAPRINYQKGRIDLLNKLLNGESELRNLDSRLLAREDVYGLIEQQKRVDIASKRSPRLIFMDSFSDLTDQQFHSKEHGTFYTNYSDLKQERMPELETNGLLNLNEFGANLRLFEQSIRSKWARDVQVFYVHFPKDFEERTKMSERADRILEEVEGVASKSHAFHSIQIPTKFVEKDPSDGHPYHFSEKTFEYAASVINLKLNQNLN